MTIYKSWDGSVEPTLEANGFAVTPATIIDCRAVTEYLAGNSGPYMQFTAVSSATKADEALIHTNGSLKYDAPYAAININVYGKSIRDIFPRLNRFHKAFIGCICKVWQKPSGSPC